MGERRRAAARPGACTSTSPAPASAAIRAATLRTAAYVRSVTSTRSPLPGPNTQGRCTGSKNCSKQATTAWPSTYPCSKPFPASNQTSLGQSQGAQHGIGSGGGIGQEGDVSWISAHKPRHRPLRSDQACTAWFCSALSAAAVSVFAGQSCSVQQSSGWGWGSRGPCASLHSTAQRSHPPCKHSVSINSTG